MLSRASRFRRSVHGPTGVSKTAARMRDDDSSGEQS
jgi:hypothetical protein